MAVKIAILIVFFAVMILVGIRARKKVTGVNDFVMGGRSIGPWMTAFSYGTSYFSAVVFIGYAGQFGWKFGISSTWIGIGNALIGSLLAWIILGRRTRVMTKHLSSATMPDFFGKRFDSKALKVVASAIAFIFLIPYTASVYNGLSKLFALAFDIPYWVCVVAMAVLTGVYVILGGYMATSVNDFIQGIIMLVGIIAVIGSVLAGKGGFTQALFGLAQIAPEASEGLASAPGIFSSFFGPDPASLLGVVILTSLGTWGLPQMVQKFYAIKDEKAVKKGTIVSTAFAFIVAGGSYFLGGFGRLFTSEAVAAGVVTESGVAYDGIIPLMLQSALSDILIGIVVVLVLSASMSTLSALVLTSSSTLTLDLIRGTIVKDMSQKKQLVFIRVFVLFFIAISVIIALDPPAFIAQLMGISWGALAGAFLAPFLYGLYWKKVTRAAVWASFACGVGVTVSNMFIGYMSPIDAGAVAMIAGLVVVPIVSLITKSTLSKEAGRIDGIFECYNEKVLVRKAEQLASEE
ncbi:MAG: sodium/solute symporter [Lachnospiraceae bacterium]|nr:sodium/solute symporter [Lachnospiraceae bacterium]